MTDEFKNNAIICILIVISIGLIMGIDLGNSDKKLYKEQDYTKDKKILYIKFLITLFFIFILSLISALLLTYEPMNNKNLIKKVKIVNALELIEILLHFYVGYIYIRGKKYHYYYSTIIGIVYIIQFAIALLYITWLHHDHMKYLIDAVNEHDTHESNVTDAAANSAEAATADADADDSNSSNSKIVM